MAGSGGGWEESEEALRLAFVQVLGESGWESFVEYLRQDDVRPDDIRGSHAEYLKELFDHFLSEAGIKPRPAQKCKIWKALMLFAGNTVSARTSSPGASGVSGPMGSSGTSFPPPPASPNRAPAVDVQPPSNLNRGDVSPGASLSPSDTPAAGRSNSSTVHSISGIPKAVSFSSGLSPAPAAPSKNVLLSPKTQGLRSLNDGPAIAISPSHAPLASAVTRSSEPGGAAAFANTEEQFDRLGDTGRGNSTFPNNEIKSEVLFPYSEPLDSGPPTGVASEPQSTWRPPSEPTTCTHYNYDAPADSNEAPENDALHHCATDSDSPAHGMFERPMEGLPERQLSALPPVSGPVKLDLQKEIHARVDRDQISTWTTFMNALAPGPVEAVKVSVRWCDQGYGNKKGQLRLHISRGDSVGGGNLLFSFRSRGGLQTAPQVLCWDLDLYTEDEHQMLGTIQQGDVIHFQYYVGDGGGHQLHIYECSIEMIPKGHGGRCSHDSEVAKLLREIGRMKPVRERVSLSDIISCASGQPCTEGIPDADYLGQGAFGKVYKCRISDEAGGELVAVKSIIHRQERSQMDNLKTTMRFVKETRHLCELRHKYMLSCYGWAEDDGSTFYMLTQFCPGGQLRERLDKLSEAGGLSPDHRAFAACGCGVAMGSALAWIHRSNVRLVHMDVAARNVLVACEPEAFADMATANNPDIYKLGDVGLLGPEGSVAEQGVSVPWSPPEVLKLTCAKRKATRPHDVWAYGCLLYEILHEPPFESDKRRFPEPEKGGVWVKSVMGIISSGGHASDPPAEVLKQEQCRSLWEIVQKQCWELTVQSRPSMGEVLRQVSEVRGTLKLKGSAVPASQPEPEDTYEPEAVWEWQDDGGLTGKRQWRTFEAIATRKLEKARAETRTTLSMTVAGQPYAYDLNKMIQRNTNTQKRRKIRRRMPSQEDGDISEWVEMLTRAMQEREREQEEPPPEQFAVQTPAEQVGPKLRKRDGSEVDTAAALQGKTVALYFGGEWCPHCKNLSPHANAFYREMQNQGANFELVYVSGDRSEQEALDYFSRHEDWLMMPFHSRKKAPLERRYGVQGIPTIVILNPDGTLVTKDGRDKMSGGREAALLVAKNGWDMPDLDPEFIAALPEELRVAELYPRMDSLRTLPEPREVTGTAETSRIHPGFMAGLTEEARVHTVRLEQEYDRLHTFSVGSKVKLNPVVHGRGQAIAQRLRQVLPPETPVVVTGFDADKDPVIRLPSGQEAAVPRMLLIAADADPSSSTLLRQPSANPESLDDDAQLRLAIEQSLQQ
eukprot:Hpha_TRINITY_DN8456_c0_g1::TRINITY_DN8456_c0_g1_i1::g.34647::m.34647